MLKGSDFLLVGCVHVYRNGGRSDQNNDKLLYLMSTAVGKKHSHLLIAGDFNYPDIDWKTWTCKSNETQEYKFIAVLRDNFRFQHAEHPTWGIGRDAVNSGIGIVHKSIPIPELDLFLLNQFQFQNWIWNCSCQNLAELELDLELLIWELEL